MIKAQLSKPWESKVRTVNNFRVLARLPFGELGRALYSSAQAYRRASITQGPAGPTRRRGGWKPPTKTPGARAQVTLPVSPAAALLAEVADRARVPPPAPVGPGPASPAAGTGGGPGGDTPTPPPQAGGGDALPNRAAAHHRSPRDRAGGGDAVTCRGLCRSPPAPLSWQPRQPHEGRQPRAW